MPTFTVGPASFIPIPGKKTWYVNDSVFPFMPSRDGKGVLAFLGDAIVMRYSGPDIEHLTPPENDMVVTTTPAPGVDGAWHKDGGWMLTATRQPDGTLVAFVHGENHSFADGKYGEWNSTGAWTSTDDGLTWTDWGEAVGSKKPDQHAFGGLAMNECIWDAANKRWLGYAGPHALISTDPLAKPGTWFGYKDGAFSEPIDVNAVPHLSPAPGLEKAGVTWGGLTYNSYLKQYIMTWVAGHKVMAAFSADGVTWDHVTTLFESDDEADKKQGDDITYAFLVGDTDTASGQDCWLVYMHHPPGKTLSGNRKDMMRRPVHFDLSVADR